MSNFVRSFPLPGNFVRQPPPPHCGAGYRSYWRLQMETCLALCDNKHVHTVLDRFPRETGIAGCPPPPYVYSYSVHRFRTRPNSCPPPTKPSSDDRSLSVLFSQTLIFVSRLSQSAPSLRSTRFHLNLPSLITEPLVPVSVVHCNILIPSSIGWAMKTRCVKFLPMAVLPSGAKAEPNTL